MGTLDAVRSVLAIALTFLVVLLAAACGGGEEMTATPETVEGTVPQENGETGETGESGETGEDGGGGGGEGDPQAGEEIFASAGCGGCHALEAAGASGTTGPNLDDSDASYDDAYEQIENGGGGMPAFKDQLSEKELADVTAFVVESRGGG